MMNNRDWFRIDKGDGSVALTASVNVFRAAISNYHKPIEVINAGRFDTPFAIYSQRLYLTSNEVPKE